MMEIKFGPGNRRYLEFTKNRRGGSLVNKPLFYSMADGQVVYDQASWDQLVRAEEVAHTEEARREELESEFDDLFLSATLQTSSVEEPTESEENKIEVEQ